MKIKIETEIGELEYSETGKGEPILFIHGGHSNSEETLFHKGYDTNKYRLITPSRPGYGNTPLGNKVQPKEAAKLIKSLIEKLKLEKINLVGISAGGLTAIELGVLLEGKLKKLILISAVTKKWLTPEDELYKRGKKMFSSEKEKRSWQLFRFFFRLFPRLMARTLFNELSTKRGDKITKKEIKEIREMTFKQSSGEGFVIDLDHNIEKTIIEKIECPTLILHSKNDKSVKMEMAIYASRKIKNSILKTYDNKWGHLLWIGEDSKYPIEDVNNFLKN